MMLANLKAIEFAKGKKTDVVVHEVADIKDQQSPAATPPKPPASDHWPEAY